jgi:hypothetical protein
MVIDIHYIIIFLPSEMLADYDAFYLVKIRKKLQVKYLTKLKSLIGQWKYNTCENIHVCHLRKRPLP